MTTTLSQEAGKKLLLDFYKACDAFDFPAIQDYLTEDCKADIGNAVVCGNPDEVVAHFQRVFTPLESFTHQIDHVDVVGDRIYCLQTALVVVKDEPREGKDRVISFQGMVMFRVSLESDQIWRIQYIKGVADGSTVFKRITELKSQQDGK
ncbi:hypothetical protein KVR01_000541 [Diaporthe batatas]|uniref:uncharacterized protein n=1 Tax=Diaporthe batatas TaxID=748121 RepID=UPI001D04E3E7|nr:uncharacterized protein KVR01_000541 [Diaporthe batatas]KAG8169796.1 hypothetical protein KVR01_000541 [Diaporthe batatas]